MKSQFAARLRLLPRVTRRDLPLTLLPFAIWMALVYARPWFIQPFCAAVPTPCSKESVCAVDRLGLGMESPEADAYSYFTQNLSGVLAASVPAIYAGVLGLSGTLTAPLALAAVGTDLTIFAQTAGINGMLTEAAHLMFQRPRPFVYSDPVQRGRDPNHYTSFYSGHTSFAAAAGVGMFITLMSRAAPAWLLFLMGGTVHFLVSTTGIFRIFAGRHFLTDVLAAAVAGALVALAVALFHRRNASPS